MRCAAVGNHYTIWAKKCKRTSSTKNLPHIQNVINGYNELVGTPKGNESLGIYWKSSYTVTACGYVKFN